MPMSRDAEAALDGLILGLLASLGAFLLWRHLSARNPPPAAPTPAGGTTKTGVRVAVDPPRGSAPLNPQPS